MREPAPPEPGPVARIDLPAGDFDVAAPDLARYDRTEPDGDESTARTTESSDLG